MTNDPNKTTMYTPESVDTSAHNGPVLGIIVIVLVLIFGGLYLWGSELRKEEAMMPQPQIINNEPETPRAEADIEILNTMSPSDDLAAIEADISSTDLDSINADLNTVDAEVDATYAQ